MIALSGKLGSGKSTVCAILHDKYAYEIYSTGKIQREIAQKMGITTLELNLRMRQDCSLDHEIDDAVAEASVRRAGERIIFDSRMAWHFAKGAYRVYVYVDPTVAAKRVLADNRGDVEKYSGVQEARDMLLARAREENARYKRIYGVDNFDYANYDLIIDSTSLSPEEAAELIEQYSARGEKAILLSPECLFPAAGSGEGDITVTVDNGYHFVTGGTDTLKKHILAGKRIIGVSSAVPGSIGSLQKKLLDDYSAETGVKFESLPENYI